jgi:hypothetical protein
MTAELDVCTLVMAAETDDEIEFLRAVAEAVGYGGTVSIHNVTALTFDGDERHMAKQRKRRKNRRSK